MFVGILGVRTNENHSKTSRKYANMHVPVPVRINKRTRKYMYAAMYAHSTRRFELQS